MTFLFCILSFCSTSLFSSFLSLSYFSSHLAFLPCDAPASQPPSGPHHIHLNIPTFASLFPSHPIFTLPFPLFNSQLLNAPPPCHSGSLHLITLHLLSALEISPDRSSFPRSIYFLQSLYAFIFLPITSARASSDSSTTSPPFLSFLSLLRIASPLSQPLYHLQFLYCILLSTLNFFWLIAPV